MTDYEKLGVFYLGAGYDLASRQRTDNLHLLDSKQLVTHGLIIGMTGSGKTGLGIDLIEEAAIDGIPVLVIDPKGDLGNLLLTFPELSPEQFAPWVNPEEAQRQSLSVPEYARQQAELWQQGLAKWKQGPERVQRLRAAAEFAIYTPGSSSGRPVSILKSFHAPAPEIQQDFELLSERVASTVAGLLGLVGIEADPVRSRETILLSNLLQSAWAKGRNLDLGGLIQEVQNPSISRIGVMEIESFYPAKDRFELAMQLNNLLAAPAFAAWLEGEPLEIKNLLYTPAGKPRVTILSIAHLGDKERMFFVTLVLNELLSWMRLQSGTSSLRALLYMDEIFGYFPPVANPPSKLPLLTLVKQARAFGLGVVLSTQNPVDLDYKGLANIGTWFIGRLQTDRDKARVLEGLEGAAAGRAGAFDRGRMEQVLAGLGNRVFLQHSVYESEPDIFETRWTLSYLRGPLNRAEVKSLAGTAPAAPVVPTAALPGPPPASTPAPTQASPGLSEPPNPLARPVLPPGVPQYFAPVRQAVPATDRIVYFPRLLGAAQVRFKEAKAKIDVTEDVSVMAEITNGPIPVDWSTAERLELQIRDLQTVPTEAEYQPCGAAAGQLKNYAGWSKDFANWIYGEHKVQLLRSGVLGLLSNPGKRNGTSASAFSKRRGNGATSKRKRFERRYAPKLAALQDRLRRAEAGRQRESEQASQAKFGALVSLGSTLMGAFLGRKTFSSGTVGRAATTMRGAGRAMQQSGDVKRAAENVESLQQQLEQLDTEFKAETSALAALYDPATETLEKLELTTTKSLINVRLLALVWPPFRRDPTGIVSPLWV